MQGLGIKKDDVIRPKEYPDLRPLENGKEVNTKTKEEDRKKILML